MFVSCTLKKVDLEFIVVLIMCFATVFSVGTEVFYIYLLWKSTNIQYSALTPRLITPIIGHAIYCFSFLFKVKNVSFGGFDPRPLALSSSVWSNVLCLRFHQYQPYGYLYTCIQNYAYRLLCIKIISYQKK